MADGELNYQDELFLEYLFDIEQNPAGNPEVAKQLAGFPEDETVAKILRRIKGEYQEEMQNYFLSISPKAATMLFDIAVGKRPVHNAQHVITACKDILDRAGVTKKDRQEIELTLPEGVIILPELNKDVEE